MRATVPHRERGVHRRGPGFDVAGARTCAMAQPDEDRHLHPRPTPRLGGIAMFAGFAVAIAIFGSGITDRWQILAVTADTIAMAVDDILDLNWLSKLGIELGVGVLAVVLGITITNIAVPGAHVSQWELGLLAAPVTVVWLVGMQVSVNLLDGADGVAAGVIAIVAAVCLLAAINRIEFGQRRAERRRDHERRGDGLLPRLPHLQPPARPRLHGRLGLALPRRGARGDHHPRRRQGRCGTLHPGAADRSRAPHRRYGIRHRPAHARQAATRPRPDAGHLHHRLRAVGMTPLETAFTFYLVTGILGCLALTIYGHRRIIDVALGLMVVALIVLIWRNRRRVPRLPFVAVEESEVQVDGHRALPTHIRHRGEAD